MYTHAQLSLRARRVGNISIWKIDNPYLSQSFEKRRKQGRSSGNMLSLDCWCDASDLSQENSLQDVCQRGFTIPQDCVGLSFTHGSFFALNEEEALASTQSFDLTGGYDDDEEEEGKIGANGSGGGERRRGGDRSKDIMQQNRDYCSSPLPSGAGKLIDDLIDELSRLYIDTSSPITHSTTNHTSFYTHVGHQHQLYLLSSVTVGRPLVVDGKESQSWHLPQGYDSF